MVAANRVTPAGQRDVDGIGRQPCFHRRCFQRFAPLIEGLLDSLLGLVDLLPGGRALFRSELAQRFQASSDLALLAEVRHPDRIECGEVCGCIDLGSSLRYEVA